MEFDSVPGGILHSSFKIYAVILYDTHIMGYFDSYEAAWYWVESETSMTDGERSNCDIREITVYSLKR